MLVTDVCMRVDPFHGEITRRWLDPVPAVDHELVDEQDIASLTNTVLASGLWRLHTWQGMSVCGHSVRS